MIRFSLLLTGLLVAGLAWSPRVHAQGQNAGTAPQLTRAPSLVQFVEAAYPESERASGRTASVVLRIVISETGAVSDATVLESAGEAFDAAALEAVRQFVFTPAEIDHIPAAITINYRYQFVLREEVVQVQTAALSGVVRDADTRLPVPGVTVQIVNGPSAVTGEDGAFAFEAVEPGTRAVRLEGERLTAVELQETLEAAQRYEVEYQVVLLPLPGSEEEEEEDGDLLEIVVNAPALRRQLVSTEVTADQARVVPGTQGDVLRVVENLPGVARATAGSGQLVVWGASPDATRVYVDGVPVPRLYHDGGLRSILHNDMVRAVELVPGGYGSAYGRGLGGLVSAQTVDLEGTGFHGSASADVLDLGAFVRVGLDENVRFALAFRRSHIADLAPAVAGSQVGQFFPLPRYFDGQARLVWQIDSRARLEIVGLGSSDELTRGVPSADPARVRSETRSQAFYRLYARYRRDLEDGAQLTVTPFVGFDESAQRQSFGALETRLGATTVLFGVRTSWRKQVADWLTLEAGLDAEVSVNDARRAGSLGLPSREGDLRVFGQAPPDQIASDTWAVTQVGVAPYLEGDISLFGGDLHVFPGLRLDPYARSISRRVPVDANTPELGLFRQDLSLEPRLSARWQLFERLSVKAAFGLYHQAPSAQDLSAAFGNPALPAQSGLHAVWGATFGLTSTLSVEATGFFTESDGLAMRNPIDAPAIAEVLRASGRGRSYGGQVLVRQELAEGFFGWLSYTLMRAERKNDDTTPWRTFDLDQTHVLTALLSYKFSFGLEVGVRARFATGFPRSQISGRYWDARRDDWQPTFETQNGIRIPSFFQLDVRVGYTFDIGSTTLDAYLEVQNATNNTNAEEIVYATDYTRASYITGIPILPVAGLRWQW